MSLNRRRLLASGSTALLALSAGCVADGTDPGAGGDGEDDGNGDDGNGDDGNDGGENGDGEADGGDGGNGTDEGSADEGGNETDESGTVNEEEEGEGESRREDDENGDSGEYAIVDRETVRFSGDGETRAEALYSAAEVEDALDRGRLSGDASKEVDALVEGTDFDRSIVLLLGARAPTLCYGIELRDLDVEGGDLTARAAAVDESGADEACAQAVHTPTLLVRVVFEDAVPQSGTINVTDGWGAGHGSGYSRGSDSASERP